MKRILATLCLTIFVLLTSQQANLSGAEIAGVGIVKGDVFNKTLNQKVIDNLEVVLYNYRQNETTEMRRTRTYGNGTFVFQEINMDEDNLYYVSTRYKNVDYFSQMLMFQQTNEIQLNLAVFEPTVKDNDLRIKMHHVLLEKADEGLTFKEIMIVENTGNRVYVGSKPADSNYNGTLRMLLPKEAVDVRVMTPSLINSADGLIDTAEIMPGTRQILFSYMINPEKPSYVFEKDFFLDTERFNLIFPEKGIRIQSNQLQVMQPPEKLKKSYLYLNGANFEKGDRIAVKIHLAKEYTFFKWFLGGLGVLIVGTAFAIPFVKSRKYQKPDEDGPHPLSNKKDLIEKKRDLIRAIAKVDEQLQSGKISSEEHFAKRQALKESAVEITKMLQGLED